MGYFLPLREAENPVRRRWSGTLMRLGLVVLVLVAALTEMGLLVGDTRWWWLPISLISAGLTLFWSVEP